MDVLQIDVTAVVAILVGGLSVLIPIVGLTARVVIPPIVEAIARARTPQATTVAMTRLEARFTRLEQRLESIERRAPQVSTERELERTLVSIAV